MASYLAPEYGYVVRVGGPNAGHTVFEVPDKYTFHQLPSGTRCREAKLRAPGVPLDRCVRFPDDPTLPAA